MSSSFINDLVIEVLPLTFFYLTSTLEALKNIGIIY